MVPMSVNNFTVEAKADNTRPIYWLRDQLVSLLSLIDKYCGLCCHRPRAKVWDTQFLPLPLILQVTCSPSPWELILHINFHPPLHSSFVRGCHNGSWNRSDITSVFNVYYKAESKSMQRRYLDITPPMISNSHQNAIRGIPNKWIDRYLMADLIRSHISCVCVLLCAGVNRDRRSSLNMLTAQSLSAPLQIE